MITTRRGAVREEPARTSVRGLLNAVVVVAALVLAWSGTHWLWLRLADPHAHLHGHGVGHASLADGRQQLVELHSYLGPAAALSGLVLLAALLGVRALPGGGRRGSRSLAGRLPALAAGLSASVFIGVEIAEQALTTHQGPPVGLLAVGLLLHAGAGLAAGALSRAVLTLPAARRRGVAVLATPMVKARATARAASPHPRVLLAVLAGRAPPVYGAPPQPSL